MINRQFLVFLGIGLAVVGIALIGTLYTTKGSHLNLEGKVLKVRTIATDDKNSIAVVDFRVTNQATKQIFIVKEAFIIVNTRDGKQVEGITVARRDMDRVFDYYKILGPKYNETLIMRDKIAGGQTMDRMVAAAIPLPESDIEQRKSLTLRLVDVDGPTFEFTSPNQAP